MTDSPTVGHAAGPGCASAARTPPVVAVMAGPDVQILGDTAAIRGAAALDAYRLISEGIGAVRRRDGIEPSARLLQTVAALKLAAEAARSRGPDSSDIADVRDRRTSAPLRTGELVGVGEVAGMFGIGVRQARRLAPSLGGQKKRSGQWVFDRGIVRAYIESEEKRMRSAHE
jgi:hypothetical protein